MRSLLPFLFLVFFCLKSSALATLTFGNATPQSPGMTLRADVDASGRLLQTITWTFQASQCEVLVRTDDSVTARAIQLSLTSSCVKRNVCMNRGPSTTPISCEEFMRILN